MSKVLVIGAGTQGLAIVHALKQERHTVVILCADKYNYAGLSRYVDKRVSWEISEKSDCFIDYLKSIIKKESIDVVIPMGDSTAHFLSSKKEQLQQIVKFKSPELSCFMRGYDKNQLMQLCEGNGYPHPKTLDMSKIELGDMSQLENFPYPAMLKPNLTTGGRGMVKVVDYKHLKELYPSLHKKYGDYHLQQFIKPGGRQVKVQLFVGEDRSLVASSVIEKRRWYPIQGGSNCCAITIKDEAIVDICYHILLDLNWFGFADFDLIEDPDTHQLLVMEINPRVPACIKSPIAAGLNWGEVIVNAALGLPQKQYNYREGVILRHLGFEMLWFMKSPNRWHANPSWFKFFGKDVYYQDMSDWKDPMPFLSGTWRNFKKIITGNGKGAV